MSLRVHRQVGSLRKILSQQTIGVLIILEIAHRIVGDRVPIVGAVDSETVMQAFEPESPFPGNGIVQAETKAPKQRLDPEAPSTETKRARVSPPIRGFSHGDGKSAFA
jgi:hypothetical protein